MLPPNADSWLSTFCEQGSHVGCAYRTSDGALCVCQCHEQRFDRRHPRLARAFQAAAAVAFLGAIALVGLLFLWALLTGPSGGSGDPDAPGQCNRMVCE